MHKDMEEKVIAWAEEKGIFTDSEPEKQLGKTLEELMELMAAVHDKNLEEIQDAIGDIIVTLIIQAEMWGLSASNCLQSAYDVIKHRKGEMKDGVFVKEG